MLRIEERFSQYPGLREQLEKSARGKGTLKSYNAKKFGYEDENGLFADHLFMVDVFEWLLGKWAEKPTLNEREQIATLEAFIFDSSKSFRFSDALLTAEPKGKYAPLARMVGNASFNNKKATAYLCLLTAARTGKTSSFPEGFFFPGEPRRVSENLRDVHRAIYGWLASSGAGSDYSRKAVENILRGPKGFWHSEPMDSNKLLENMYRQDGGVLLAQVTEEGAATNKKDGANPTPSPNVTAKRPPRPDNEEDGEKGAVGGGLFNLAAREEEGRGKSSIVVPIEFDPALFGAPFEKFAEAFEGIDDLKKELGDYVLGLAFEARAYHLGLKPPEGFPNVLFTGPAGVGKTSLAKALACALKGSGGLNRKASIGILSCPNLVGRYVGTTEEKLLGALNAHKGGVLVLDEIDSLIDVHSYGKNALNALNTHMGNMDRPPIVIATLYPRNLETLFEQNDGLRRRFANVFRMEGYSPEVLMKIFAGKVERAGMVCPPDVCKKVGDYLFQEQRARGSSFAQAGAVDGLFKKVWRQVAQRVVEECPQILDPTCSIGKLPNFRAIKENAGTLRLEDIPVYQSKWKNPIALTQEAETDEAATSAPQRPEEGKGRGKVIPLFGESDRGPKPA